MTDRKKSPIISTNFNHACPGDEIYKKLVENASDGIAIIQDSFVRYANPTLIEMLGYSKTNVLNTSFRDYLPPDSLETVTSFYRALEKNDVPDIYEISILHRDGHAIPVEINTSLIIYDEKPADFVIFRSLKERRDQHKIAHRLQQFQKLESLGVLAGGISHDFNNLLQGILGNADLALMYEKDPEMVRTCLKDIKHAANKASELALKMLAYSGKGSFDIRNIDLNRLIDETIELHDLAIPRITHLSLSLTPNLPPIRGDHSQLAQVIVNLLNNAIEAIGEQPGTITISTELCKCDRAMLSDTFLDEKLPEGTYIELKIEDTGCGIEAGVVDKIFDPFFSTKFTGRGLGLAAVLGIIRAHSGAISVESSFGGGSCFTLYLPLSEQSQLLVGGSSMPPLENDTSATVLLVDDESTVRTTATRILERFGYSVIVAPDGKSALNIFARAFSQIDIVLLDMMMPKMDGKETFSKLCDIHPNVNVILMSGYQEAEVRGRFGDNKPTGFLQKPFSARKLISLVRKIQNED